MIIATRGFFRIDRSLTLADAEYYICEYRVMAIDVVCSFFTMADATPPSTLRATPELSIEESQRKCYPGAA